MFELSSRPEEYLRAKPKKCKILFYKFYHRESCLSQSLAIRPDIAQKLSNRNTSPVNGCIPAELTAYVGEPPGPDREHLPFRSQHIDNRRDGWGIPFSIPAMLHAATDRINRLKQEYVRPVPFVERESNRSDAG
jgi:hypothetical protein